MELHKPATIRREAFTLIELLVVISIIALLIAVLLPALSAARQSAQRVLCASNARQQGIGVQVYAQEYHGNIPPIYTTNGRDSYIVDAPFRTRDLSWRSMDSPVKRSIHGDWVMAGALYYESILTSGEVLFCPSVPQGMGELAARSYDMAWEDYQPFPLPGQIAHLQGYERIRTGYNFNPQADFRDNRWHNRYQKLDHALPGAILGLDVISEDQIQGRLFVAHRQNGVPGWNVLTMDGSVAFLNDPIIANYINQDIHDDMNIFQNAIDTIAELR